MPYAYKNGKAYFLFGLENRTWDKGRWTQKAYSKWVWAQFAGHCEVADTAQATQYKTDAATYCAARETTEESRYVFGNKLPLNRFVNKRSQEFKNSIKYWINHITGRFFEGEGYEHFFAEVDYIDPQKLNSGPKVSGYEKQEYKWIKVTDVMNALKNPDKDGFIRFAFQHHRTNKMFPPLAGTLRRTQNFINNTILAKEKIIPPTPVTPPVTPSTPKPELQALATDLQKLQRQLNNLTRQLQALQ